MLEVLTNGSYFLFNEGLDGLGFLPPLSSLIPWIPLSDGAYSLPPQGTPALNKTFLQPRF